MRRLVALLAAVGVISGCTSSGSGSKQAVDPFFGRTRVEPPPTGWNSGQPAPDPYYAGTRQSTGPQTNLPPARGMTGSTATPSFLPAGRYGSTPASGSNWAPAGSSRAGPALTLPPPPNSTQPAATQPLGASQLPAAGQPPIAYPGPGSSQLPVGSQPSTGSLNYKGASAAPAGTFALAAPGDRIAIPLAARQVSDSPWTGAARTATDSWSGPAAATSNESAAKAGATSSAVASAGPLAPNSLRTADSGLGTGLAGRERIVRVLEPRPGESAGLVRDASTPRTTSIPGRATGTQQAVDIMDLPPAGSSTPYRGSQSTAGAGDVQLVSATEETDGPATGSPRDPRSSPAPTAGSSAASTPPPSLYGHDPNYAWLRGKLEYSQLERGWRLRYVPAEGQADQYGGSVVLSDAKLLAGYERGDFVEVLGKLTPAASADRASAPSYAITQIKRLGS